MVLLNWSEIFNRLVDWHPVPSNETTNQYKSIPRSIWGRPKIGIMSSCSQLVFWPFVCVFDQRDRVLLTAVCAEWPYEGPIRRPERGEWMGADKNSSRRRLKLRQDELARSDPKITRSALLPSVCQNHVATGVLLVLEQTLPATTAHTHQDIGNNSKVGCPEGGG
jgi:hypothetical protein